MREYPNTIQQSLEKDEAFNQELQAAIVKKFNDTEIFLVTDKVEAKIFNNPETSSRYLAVKNVEQQKITVYEEQVSSWNKKEPFKYGISTLQEQGKVYSNKVYTFILNSKNKVEDDVSDDEIDGLLTALENIKDYSKEKAQELFEKLKRHMKRESNDPDYFVSSSPYNIKQFSAFFGVERSNDFWIQLSTPLNSLIDKKVSEYSIAIKYFFDVAKEQSFNEKNKFTFNDLDNHLWKKGNGIAFDDQNLGFLCLKQDDTYQNFTIYCYDIEGNNCKSNSTLNKLIKDLKENGEKLIDNVALKVENGKATFVDNALIYCLDLDILCTKNAMVSDGYGEPTYPVDLYSYAYQLSYYQKQYKLSEMEFLQQAILTLGSGFEYDSKNGRFFDDGVIYSPDVVGYKLEKDNHLQSIYGYPANFDNLDPSWTSAVERLLKTLKEDRPQPIIVDGEKEKEDKLNEIIQFYEKKVAGFSSKKIKP